MQRLAKLNIILMHMNFGCKVFLLGAFGTYEACFWVNNTLSHVQQPVSDNMH